MSAWRLLRLAILSLLALMPRVGTSAFIPENQRLRPTITIHVAPEGDDQGDGSAAHPYRSLTRAQQAVRAANESADVVVVLAGGWYRLTEPLRFAAIDGGQSGGKVTWRAADGAQPVIAGSFAVTGWRLHDAEKQIYVADIPVGVEARQLWVNDRLASPGVLELDRARITFDSDGMVIDDPQLDHLARLPGKRLEVHSTGWFTNRISPVRDIVGRKLLMQQPAWDNNTWGYDTLHAPVGAETSHLFLANSLSFVREPRQFYLDPDAGKLYLRPEPGTDIRAMRVEMPRLQYLLSVSGSHERPVRDLAFEGIRFSYTSWLAPSSDEGYADQQSGAFLKGLSPARPRDAIRTCVWGCREFETRRNDWSQMPAAVQVSAAERVSFDRIVFAHLGQIALGIGNNPDAHASGVGLGARSITVQRSVFTDLAGGAILAGGICRDAHHPPDPRMANRDVTIINNRIQTVSQTYRDNSAILSTYVDGVLILHNEISDAPYDAIDIGWGWGVNDPGGNPVYRDARRGYYDHPENLVYESPTLHRRARVAYNRIHHVKKLFHDGGAIYNLSASPDTVIAENYIHDIPERIGLYLDEGSRYVTIRNNVVDGAGVWLNVNTFADYWPLRATTDNLAVGNWFSTAKVTGGWDAYYDNRMEANVLVERGRWPAAARRVIENAGIQKSAGVVAYVSAAQ
jgi:hypothetical protein